MEKGVSKITFLRQPSNRKYLGGSQWFLITFKNNQAKNIFWLKSDKHNNQ